MYLVYNLLNENNQIKIRPIHSIQVINQENIYFFVGGNYLFIHTLFVPVMKYSFFPQQCTAIKQFPLTRHYQLQSVQPFIWQKLFSVQAKTL